MQFLVLLLVQSAAGFSYLGSFKELTHGTHKANYWHPSFYNYREDDLTEIRSKSSFYDVSFLETESEKKLC